MPPRAISTEEVEDADANEIGRLGGSREHLRDDVAMHVGEPDIPALYGFWPRGLRE